MSIRFLPVLLTLASLALPGQEARPPLPAQLSLAAAKRIALADNPTVKALLARIAAAEAVVGQTRAAMRPRISATAGAAWLQDVSLANGDADGTPVYQLGLQADWLLFDGFASDFRTAAAKAGVEASLAEWEDGRRLLAQGVAVSFLNCLLAEESGRVAERDAQFNRELLDEARKRLDAGAGPRVDVLNFQVRAQTAENTLLGTRREARAARQALASLLGLPDGDLPAETTLATDEEPPAALPAVAEAIAGALSRRPDLLRHQHVLDQIAAAIDATRASYRPMLSAQASYALARADNPRFHADRDADSSVGLGLSWNLFDGHLRRDTIAENRALLLAASELRNQSRVDIAAEVRRQLDSAATAAKQHANQREITELVREIRAIVRKEYLAGLSPLTRLNEAQTDLVRAEGALSQTHIRQRQAFEALAAALGANLPPSQ